MEIYVSTAAREAIARLFMADELLASMVMQTKAEVAHAARVRTEGADH